MHWFRTHIRNGSTLALIALAIQMVLAFGHFHAGHAAAAPGASIEHSQSPSGPDHDRHAAHPCDICAITAMASALLAASPPALVVPPITSFRLLQASAASADFGASGLAFQPRGPPLS